jgi:hypothetical protein
MGKLFPKPLTTFQFFALFIAFLFTEPKEALRSLFRSIIPPYFWYLKDILNIFNSSY